MERLIQFLDDFEDIIYAAPLILEQLRRAIQRVLFLLVSFCLQTAGIILALEHPPLALAIVALFAVGMLFRAVVMRVPRPSPVR